MPNKLKVILSDMERQHYATDAGTKMHIKLQKIKDCTSKNSDDELCKKISSDSMLSMFFSADSKAEVPVAGYINNRFISRRIDRLFIDSENKTVYILDYKTDSDKNTFRDKYINQLTEYKKLLRDIYSQYKVRAFLLWLTDFELEEVS